MSKSGATVNPECVNVYNELKLSKKLKYIIYKMSDNYTEIVIEDKSESSDWDEFREKLVAAESTAKGRTGKGPRYAVYDFHYELSGGEGSRNKIIFIAWSPDDGLVQPKMIYASSKESLKNALTGLSSEIQANDQDDIEYQSILKEISKGRA